MQQRVDLMLTHKCAALMHLPAKIGHTIGFLERDEPYSALGCSWTRLCIKFDFGQKYASEKCKMLAYNKLKHLAKLRFRTDESVSQTTMTYVST